MCLLTYICLLSSLKIFGFDDNEGHSDLFWKDSFDDAFQDDDDEPLVQAGKLEHLKEHCQAGPARLTSWWSENLTSYFPSNDKCVDEVGNHDLFK